MGNEFVGCIKTAHAGFPKKFLEDNLKDKCAGSQLILFNEVDGVELLAIGYKYNKRKVLFFVATVGSGATTEGTPYIQRWADEHGNVLTRNIPRPAIVSTYFGISPRVDNHNQSRQHDLAIEEKWDTQNCWFRLHCTLFGMVITDMWKLVKFHVSPHHRLKKATIAQFADEVSRCLLLNNLEGDAPVRRNPGRNNTSSSDDDDLPRRDGLHTMEKFERTGTSARQSRCRWCLHHESKESWTTFYCVECDIPLCGPTNRARRKCWNLHCRCEPEDLRELSAKCAKSRRTT